MHYIHRVRNENPDEAVKVLPRLFSAPQGCSLSILKISLIPSEGTRNAIGPLEDGNEKALPTPECRVKKELNTVVRRK